MTTRLDPPAATVDSPGAAPVPPRPPRPRLPRRPWPPRFGRHFGLHPLTPTGMWRRGRIATVCALPAALLMLEHRRLPNGSWHLRSLVETFLPWTGLAVPFLLLCALLRRSATASVAAVLTAAVWCSGFGGTLADKQAGGGDLTVVTHNVKEDNPDPARTARDLAACGADLVAVQELDGDSTPTYSSALAGRYPYQSVHGTVGLWSRYPITTSATVGIAPWPRALRATVRTPKGEVVVYVAHLLSVRFTLASGLGTGARDAAARRLAAALRAEPLRRVIVMGDFNGTTGDRALSAVTSQLRSAQAEAGAGFGFTWPAAFPMARIDQILVRGVVPRSAWTLPATGSDHLPAAASLRM